MNGRTSRGTEARRWLILAGGVLTLLALGGEFAGWASRRQDRWMREDLQYQTRTIAQTLNLSQIQRLRGNASDEDNPEYRRLKEQLRAVQQLNPNWKWIYLMGRTTNGTVFFQVDSEAYDAPDPTLPGTTYEEASDVLHRVFDTGQAADEGPIPDRWGVWVSAFEPLKNSQTGELATVVGIDIEASLWAQMRARAMKVPLLCCGLLVTIFLLGAYMLARRARVGACKTWFCPYIEAFLVSAAGLTLTLTAVWLTRQNELRNREIAFRHLAQIETEPPANAAIGLHNLELEGFGAFFDNSVEVTSKEFRRYAAHLSDNSEIQSWGWAEVVEAADRARFEEYTIFRTGKLDYQIWEQNAQGLPITSSNRPLYYPIVYLSPKRGNQPILGFDIGSDSNRLAAIITANQTHLTAASDPVPLINDPEGNKGIFVVRASFHANNPGRMRGFVAADLNIRRWLQTSLQGNPSRQPMAILGLFQLQTDQPPVLLGTTDPQDYDHSDHFHHAPAEATFRPLLVFGKTYALVTHPTPAFRSLHPATTAWWVGLAGLIITVSLAWVLGWFTHRREHLARLLNEQHHELATSMRRYEMLARQSRTYTWEVDADGLFTKVGDVAREVLGYAPEELIGHVHFYDLHPAEGRKKFTALALDVIARHQPFLDLANPMVAKSGEVVWVSTNGMPILDAAGVLIGYQGTDKDITESKRAEESLTRLSQQNKEAAERYATLISASNTGAWEYHDDTAHMWASSEYFAMLGRQVSDFDLADGQPNIDATWLNLLHPDDRDRARQDFIDYLKHPDGMYQHTFRMLHADGHWVWILSRGRMLRDAAGQPTPVVVGTHIDITESKRIEAALTESEEKHRTLFREMLEGFSLHEIICDDHGRPIDYRYLAANPAFERLTGLKVDSLIGKTILEVQPNIEQKWIDTFGQVALTGTPVYFDSSSEALGRHYEVTAFRPRPNQFACIFSDITDRKRAENELRESRRQYAALLANLPGMAYRCENDRNWTMDFVSAGCQDLTGYAPEDLVGNKTVSFNNLICPPYRERLWEKWQTILREHSKFEDEYEITTRTGETKWVWEQGEGVYGEDGRIVALEGFIADITERKRTGAERERLMAAIEQSGETVLITDAAGTILYVNSAFTKATGFSREEAIGQNPRLLKSGEQDEAVFRDMWTTLLSGRVWEGQIVNRRKDGTLLTELASISPVRNAGGAIVNFVAVKRDITQQLRDEAEKDALQVQLAHAQKLESVGRLAGGVAHDFNNMLQAILGYVEMAVEQVPADQPLHADLLEIQKAAMRSHALTKQLQAFARKQVSSPKVLDLNEAVEDTFAMLRRLIGENIQLIWKPGRNVGFVRVDPSQLDQVVANLCINARDAIGDSGQITLETVAVDIHPPANGDQPIDLAPGAYAVLSVHDNGCGMAPEVVDHIFEPFFTTKPIGKGTGLGLSTAYGTVKQSRGDIRVESQPGKGSTFKIYLPRQDLAEIPPPSPSEIEAADPIAAPHETILLVEDEKVILRTTQRILESLGYRVIATDSPQEALRIASERHGQIDLLLTDVIMAGMNGPELVRQLQKAQPTIRHLFMSGYTANLLDEHGVENNKPGFIQKPFTRKALAQKVRDILARA